MPTTHPFHDLPVWDQQAALASTNGDLELARSLLAGLVLQLGDDLAAMRRLAAEQDLPQLAETAHQLRGGAVYCGVHALVAALQELEQRARAGDTALSAESLARVTDEVRRLREMNV